MLSELYIENIAVIKKAAIALSAGFNVFTGETGAGKTILVGAINAVLGERTSREMIRVGEQRALVSALFTDLSPEAMRTVEALGFTVESDGALLVSREIGADGKTSAKINGRPATISMLRQVSACLVDIHGQHDNQILLSPERHLRLIDDYAGLDGLLAEYKEEYDALCAIRRELSSISTDEAEKARRIDLLSYQVEEIEKAQLQEGEEEALLAQRRLIRNAERVAQSLQEASVFLEGNEEADGILSLMGLLSSAVNAAAEYIPDLADAAERIAGMGYELEEYKSDISRAMEEIAFDPRLLDEVEQRLDLIYSLKKKYGGSIEEVLAFGEQAARELEEITTSEERLQALQVKEKQAKVRTEQRALALREARLAAAQQFVEQVAQELAYLDMGSVRLSFAMTERELGPGGADGLELLISTNPGEPPKPMAKIASGGEISRIMLSVKNVLAASDRISTSVFDEIDTGVSGKAARKIGEKLKQVSLGRQVICVTHLAQVAAFADHHLLIAKRTDADSAITEVTALTGEQRVREIARIISGERITDLALENAREILALAKIEPSR